VRAEPGAVGIVTAALIALMLLMSVAVVDVSRLLAARAALTTAADAAALAAAPVTFSGFGSPRTPHDEAARYAAANGASVVACDCAIDRSWSERIVVVTVTTRIELRLLGTHRLRATAAAEFRPVDLAPSHGQLHWQRLRQR
jgi:uncharacterized membrane protein